MKKRRSLWVYVALGALYAVSGVGFVAAVPLLFQGHYLLWVIALVVGIQGLLAAYHLRTGRTPWRPATPHFPSYAESDGSPRSRRAR